MEETCVFHGGFSCTHSERAHLNAIKAEWRPDFLPFFSSRYLFLSFTVELWRFFVVDWTGPWGRESSALIGCTPEVCVRRRRHFWSFVDRCGATALCWLQVGRPQQVCQCAIARPSSADRSEARLHGNRSQSSAGEQRWLPSPPPLFIIGDSVPNCSKRTCVVSYARKKTASSEARNDVCNQMKLCSRTCFIARTRIPISSAK